MIRVAFFDTKAYDKPSFAQYGSRNDVEFKFSETKLTEDTADLAKGCDAVCVFVNDTVSDKVIDRLYENGVKMIQMKGAFHAFATTGTQAPESATILKENVEFIKENMACYNSF